MFMNGRAICGGRYDRISARNGTLAPVAAVRDYVLPGNRRGVDARVRTLGRSYEMTWANGVTREKMGIMCDWETHVWDPTPADPYSTPGLLPAYPQR